MRIAVLIPDRNDRPDFLKNCIRMMERQTLLPIEILVVNDPARDEKIDIGWRYKTGYERLQNKNYDVIAFIENDDWYSPIYLETMAANWEDHGKPLLIGTDYTIYYHLKLKKYFTFYHSTRSSAMSTMIRPNIDKIDWGPEHDPYTDLHLWTKIGSRMGDRIVFKPQQHICLGIKHGVGKTGGFAHIDSLERYEKDDNGFLKSVIEPVDPEGYAFYSNFTAQ